MATENQLREREKLCRERAETARDSISRANFLALADEYARQAERAELQAKARRLRTG